MPDICAHCAQSQATQCCAGCKKAGIFVYYCSRVHQRAAWKEHKKHCGTPAAGVVRAEAKATQGPVASFDPAAVLAGLGVSEGGSPGMSTAMNGKPWWQGLSVERQHERFMYSWMFRNEDAYVYRGELLGGYNPDGNAHKEFLSYWAKAKRMDMLPESCLGDFPQSEYAKRLCKCAIEKSDISEKFGYAAMEHMVLRMMAEKITGQSTMGY